MEKIVYIYGSGRNAATRGLRRGSFPREQQTRLGPWIIRPARRTAVDTLQLMRHEREAIEKVEKGIVQIQNGATAPYSVEELKAGFAALRGEPGAFDPRLMPYGELMDLMRSESPSQEVWDAFVERSLNADLAELPSRIRGLRDYAEKNSERLNMAYALRILREADDALLSSQLSTDASEAAAAAEAAAEAARLAEATAAAEAANAEMRAEQEAAAAIEAARQVTTDAPPAETAVSASEPAADQEQMDFTAPVDPAAPAAPTAEEAPAAPTKAERELGLPEDWRNFTNAKLTELLTGLEVQLPERANKANLIAAVEAWLEGS